MRRSKPIPAAFTGARRHLTVVREIPAISVGKGEKKEKERERKEKEREGRKERRRGGKGGKEGNPCHKPLLAALKKERERERERRKEGGKRSLL